MIPHVTDEIKARMMALTRGRPVDVAIVEIGGTVGDIESLPFLEAIRQLRLELSSLNTLFIHVTLVPHLGNDSEIGGATFDGVAPGAEVWAVRVLTSQGSSVASSVGLGIVGAAAQGADVINIASAACRSTSAHRWTRRPPWSTRSRRRTG